MSQSRTTRIASDHSHRATTCYFCGRWPATLYRDITEKHSHRVCEFCVEEGLVVKGTDGVYVTAPALLVDPVESPES